MRRIKENAPAFIFATEKMYSNYLPDAYIPLVLCPTSNKFTFS